MLFVGVSAMSISLPVLGQKNPESLLPPGFGDPPPPPPAAPPPPPPPSASSNPQQTTAQPSSSSQRPSGPRPASSSAQKAANGLLPASSTKSETTDPLDPEAGEAVIVRFDVPPSARRSLKQVGIISAANGGFAENAFGITNGSFLLDVARKTKGPLASRWGTIMARRLLSSRTITPRNANGADWVAERANLLLRSGNSEVARQLIQQVDIGSYSKRLVQVAMPVYLANADLSGMCPLVVTANGKDPEPTWKMAQSICASLSGEQGRASGLLNQARSKKWMVGIDYLLTEKAVGAGTNGRRSVKIEWDKVKGFNAWRFGLAYATGIEPPDRLLQLSDRHVDGWRVQLPMTSLNSRLAAADGAASLGVLSNSAMVDLYSQAFDSSDAKEIYKDRAESLANAYSASDPAQIVAAMATIWGDAKDIKSRQASAVLTARAAAMVTPSDNYGAQADQVIESLLSAGLDRSAALWSGSVSKGSLGWAMVAAGSPEWRDAIDYGDLDSFYDTVPSENNHKAALALAGLAGLGRVGAEAQKDFEEKLGIKMTRGGNWSKAITEAAARGESGTVAMLALAGMQGSDWTKVPAYQLFYITQSLKAVGLEAEARMIAAEAICYG
jgi:hypothetical protein